MKVEFDGKIVTSAWYRVDSKGCSTFVVNTKDKRMDYYSGSTPTEVAYYFPLDDESSMENDGFAKLIAENKKDHQVLSRLYFKQWDGDQLWVVFLSDTVLGLGKE